MIPAHLPDHRLDAATVPPSDGPLDELVTFGHRYHAYKVAGSLPRVAAIALELHDAWQPGATVEGSLPSLRIALFHTVRALEHGDARAVDDDSEQWIRALVSAIAASVPQDARG